ncbi:Acyl-CoA dehydrogenase domain protein OS=Tsukamurella paurometabola (strain ATCC 8368 / DSM/ CCUG 35730 / CIP 100753 / JCM 10117 / KCTC 9821 / NBRC 16120/ NCIMB 702349 / NCTC 13040) OX=521096 GN=Tpau_3797 PE=3 SV=1 [Tsukamurella paurometabola]|uniref:Acyl-CoA dehydrogenase domain protein n=1 Tax=Tsukamurella paurometabola (strain ATCC 8368 / DSM 20162 / CCUG 35730 / CIP 100753 / JCM 10117 / KCTC 9821 / NBRC 16120 / NCIMB 702349 / NCTC 13040) TaxID=521096 RepID=D5UYS2_TSUPD|nr:acyl-CoA dehydrogenase [Tsukamurella paurometabola]ADG80375.1 acyl-CoA dehydrogenase domain protein [Tsukamurella paurometabola DSM 20162]SUP39400.1 (R)-benzylsuccinyl-CoA dehydrogenase [Tsukamurella paurometabola]
MALAVTDVQLALAESIRDWAERAHPIDAARSGDPGATEKAWRGLADIGVFGITLSEELGGMGGSAEDAAAAVEAAALVLAPGPVGGTVTVAALLEHFLRDDDHLAATRAALAAGDARAAVVLGGDGTLVADAESASHLLIEAPGGMWHLLPPGHPGVRVEPQTGLDGSRPLGRVHLTEVVFHDATAVPGLTFADAEAWVATFVAAEASAVAAWALRTAAEYSRVRVQFGKPIGSFQAIKQIAADMLCRSEQAAALAWDAARSAGGGEEHRLAAAVGAAGALEAAVANAKDVIQVLGGIGFTWEHDAHLYLRRALALRQLAGGTHGLRRRAAELARSGVRRRYDVSVEGDHDGAAAEAKAIAALPEADRRRALAESGLLVPHWDPPYGRGAGPAEQIVLDTALDAAGVERPPLVIGAWAAPTILEHGTADQAQRFVWPTLLGEISWCQLFSEPEAGSDLAALRTRAVRAEGGWRLTGQKVWTSLAHSADWAICLARTNPEAPKHKGITYFLVDMRSPGIDIRPLREITGDERFNEVFLEEVFVPDECVVGDVDGGWRLARTTLANERVAMSGNGLGARLEALIGRPEIDDADLGELITEAASCALLDLRAVIASVGGQDPGPSSSVRKLVGVQHRQSVAEAALLCLGPDGAVAGPEDPEDERYEFLLTRCLSIAGGTSQILRNVAAEHLLGLPRS